MTMSDTHDDRLVLAFDTGSPITSVALARGSDVLAQEAAERASSSDSILALIDAVLTRCGVVPRDLGALCVLRGPGSFTGLRIGLATALGLHHALGVAVAVMPTLRVLAEAAVEACAAPIDRVVAVVDALRGEWFAQGFERHAGLGGPLEPSGPPQIVNAATLAALTPASLAPRSIGQVALVGFGASAIVTAAGGGAALVAIDPPPLAAVAARLAGSWPTWDAALLTEPLYLRPAPTTPAKR
jgi:tRNA threonylcarbamoyl adenosine modification protein YeaZ